MTNNERAVVKTMLFKRGKDVATVVLSVPKDHLGNCKMITRRDGTVQPNSFGVFIDVFGKDLFAPKYAYPFTKYEAYMNSQGWEFVCVVKNTYGKTIKEARTTAYIYILAYKAL